KSDKFYLVLSGKARMVVGEETREVGQGTVVWAPADLPHGVAEALEPTVMLVAMAPPPAAVNSPAAP
ncbi:MAG TPA: cupin domain-containing protein, partial [Gemmatimonadales bacterium]|nr:cupin domain-containing protein [Gemmatimonadales bacterium]